MDRDTNGQGHRDTDGQGQVHNTDGQGYRQIGTQTDRERNIEGQGHRRAGIEIRDTDRL